jgi:transmembrane sensor
MRDPEIKDLLERFKAGESTDEELVKIRYWLHHFNTSGQPQLTETELKAASKDMWLSISLSTEKEVAKIYNNWPLRAVAVLTCLLLVVGLGIYFIKSSPAAAVDFTTDINPGGNKASLTLANGKAISLSDGKTGLNLNIKAPSYTDGEKLQISIPATGNNTLSTPRGGQYQLVLPDGSKVWLNAASKLNFPSSFIGQAQRRVQLVGEAYFEISKNKAQPFVVSTGNQEVEVLGTHFNVSSYEGAIETRTTLLEGSVKVTRLHAKPGEPATKVVLKPGQQAQFDMDAFELKTIDPEIAIAWKDGLFSFRNEPLEDIMQKIARWYDADITYRDRATGKKRFGGTISKFGKVSEVLCMLALTGEVHFKIEGKTITVLP